MHAALLLLTLTVPARAGVVIAAEAGSVSVVPAITLQTALTPVSGPSLAATLTPPGLDATLAAPSIPAARALPAAIDPIAALAAKPIPLSAASTPDATPDATPGAKTGAALTPAGEPEADELPEMTYKRESWRFDGKKLERLGSGTVGFVDVHPRRSDLILKTINPSFDQLMMGLDFKTAAEADGKAAAVLADAGVGPRVIATRRIAGRYVSVRERVFGETMGRMMDARKYGEEEHRLVMEMLGRMAAAGAMVTDLVPSNVMLGTTARDPERRAYFIDGGMVEAFPEGLDAEAKVNYLLDYGQVVGVRQDPSNFKPIEMTKRFRSAVEEGLERSRPATGWQRFKQGLKRFFANAYIQPVR